MCEKSFFLLCGFYNRAGFLSLRSLPPQLLMTTLRHIVTDLRGVVLRNSRVGVEQRGEGIGPDVSDLCGIIFHTLLDVQNMLPVQLLKAAFHYRRGILCKR